MTCCEHIGRRRGETISSRGGGRGWKCNRSRESSKSKVISSVPLFLYLLSPFYGNPRSFFLPDRDSGQVHCLCSRQCISFSLSHFTFSSSPCSGPVLSLPLFLPLFLSLTLSLFHGTPLNLRSLLCKRALHHRRQFHSWLPFYVSSELLCQCQWHRYLSVRERLRALSSCACGSLNRIPFPSIIRWAKVDTSSRVSQASRSMLYGCSSVLDELLSVVNMNDAQYECTYGRRAGGQTVSANFLDIAKVYRQPLTINNLVVGRIFVFFFFLRRNTRTRSCEI